MPAGRGRPTVRSHRPCAWRIARMGRPRSVVVRCATPATSDAVGDRGSVGGGVDHVGPCRSDHRRRHRPHRRCSSTRSKRCWSGGQGRCVGANLPASRLFGRRQRSRRSRSRSGRAAAVGFSKTFGGGWAADGWLDPINGTIIANELQRREQALFEVDWREARHRLRREPCFGELRRTAKQRRADALVEMARRSGRTRRRHTRPTADHRPRRPDWACQHV